MAALGITCPEHRQAQIRQGDAKLFSANPPVGNTLAVTKIIDGPMKQGAKVLVEQGICVWAWLQEDQS